MSKTLQTENQKSKKPIAENEKVDDVDVGQKWDTRFPSTPGHMVSNILHSLLVWNDKYGWHRHTYNWIELKCMGRARPTIRDNVSDARCPLHSPLLPALKHCKTNSFVFFLLLASRFCANAVTSTAAAAVKRIYQFDVRFQTAHTHTHTPIHTSTLTIINNETEFPISSEKLLFSIFVFRVWVSLRLQSFECTRHLQRDIECHTRWRRVSAVGGKRDQFFIDKTNDRWMNRCQFNRCDKLFRR